MDIKLYSTHCPKCNILVKKLNSANIQYEEITDVDFMVNKGIKSVPMLEVNNQLMDFSEAVNWIKNNI